MDATQIVLIGAVTILTIVLSLTGIQVYFILREFRQTVKKINKMLDDGGIISGSVASLVERIAGVTGLAGLLAWLTKRNKKKEGENAQ